MSYNSKIDLGGLGEVPKTQDSEIFADMTDVYNAIHILAQWTNALVERAEAEGDKGPDQKPWELMTFEKWLWLPARQQINTGDVISSIYVNEQGMNFDGVYKGAHYIKYLQPTAGTGATKIAALVGVALEPAAPGELVKFGVGPAVINIGGVKAGDKLYTRPAIEIHSKYNTPPVAVGDGQFYLNPPFSVGTWPDLSFGSPDWPGDFTQYGNGRSGPIIPGKGGKNNNPLVYVPVALGVADDAAMILGPHFMTDYIV